MAKRRKYRSICGWVTVNKESDCPPDDSHEDYPTEYIVRVMHDDGRGGNHIETMQAADIWPTAKANDGRVDWLDENIKTESK